MRHDHDLIVAVIVALVIAAIVLTINLFGLK